MKNNRHVITKEMMDEYYNVKQRYGIKRKNWYRIADIFYYTGLKIVADKIIIFSDNRFD